MFFQAILHLWEIFNKAFTLVGSGHSSRRRHTTAAPSESSRGIANMHDLTTFSHPSSVLSKEQYNIPYAWNDIQFIIKSSKVI